MRFKLVMPPCKGLHCCKSHTACTTWWLVDGLHWPQTATLKPHYIVFCLEKYLFPTHLQQCRGMQTVNAAAVWHWESLKCNCLILQHTKREKKKWPNNSQGRNDHINACHRALDRIIGSLLQEGILTVYIYIYVYGMASSLPFSLHTF